MCRTRCIVLVAHNDSTNNILLTVFEEASCTVEFEQSLSVAVWFIYVYIAIFCAGHSWAEIAPLLRGQVGLVGRSFSDFLEVLQNFLNTSKKYPP